MKKLLYIFLLLLIFVLAGCVGEYIEPINPETVPPTTTPSPTVTPPPTEGIQTPEKTPDPTPELTPTPDPASEPPPDFGYIDAHADTISRALLYNPANQSLYDNDFLHIDFKRLSQFDAPVQIFALWLPDAYVTTAFETTNNMITFFENEVEKHSDIIEIAHDLEDIRRIAGEGKISAILSIEGGEALEGKIENLDHFYNRGVRILGLTWNNENELGIGISTNSPNGLKPFGIEVIQRMDELGMILDISHLNEAGFWDAHNTSTRPYMASHSNAHAVMPHNRNLKDEQIIAIVESGGIIGFNMFPPFIAQNGGADMDDVSAHFRHFIQLGAGNHIGFGCDFDGISSTPEGIVDVLSLKTLEDFLSEEFDTETSFKIMQGNFYEFFKRYYEG